MNVDATGQQCSAGGSGSECAGNGGTTVLGLRFATDIRVKAGGRVELRGAGG
jgi:hypothetical protein